jgi:NDP-sugar pyrophosphorylase family protein
MTMKALVLCGGKGTRLRPYTTVLPKPLMPVGDYPILEILLRQLRKAGVEDVVLAVGYMSQLFRAFFEDGARLGLNIEYSFEDRPLGTAGALASVIDRLGDNFLVTNGDLLTTLDYGVMLDAHRASGAAATIGLYRREVKIDFGVVETNDAGELVEYREKPVYRFDVSMGVNCLRTDVVKQYIVENEYLDMPDLMTRLSRNGHLVRGYRSDCFWLDIGRVDDYQQALEIFDERRAEFLPSLPPKK